jgi:hypothetical protein
LSARCGFAAAASSVPHFSCASPSNGDVDIHYGNDDDDDKYYKDNASDVDHNDYNEDKALGEAYTPLDDKNLCQVHLLAGVVHTNQHYGLGLMVPLPDASATVPAAFRAVVLQAPTFFATCSLVCANRFSGRRSTNQFRLPALETDGSFFTM